MTLSADELVTRAAMGDAAAMERLLARSRGDIRRYVRRSCRNASDAEDAVQETLLVLYRRVGALRHVGAPSGWLFQIVNRYCLRLARRLMRSRDAIEAERLDRQIAPTPAAELRLDIARAIESLPDHYREVVLLRDVRELTVDEIALRLDTTREAVKGRLHRARLMLREYLEDA